MWMTLSSLVSLLAFVDLGIGNGLVNAVATCYGKENWVEMRRLISSAFFLLVGIGVLLISVFAAVYYDISWPTVFGVTSPAARGELGSALIILICCLALNLPLGVVQRVQMGLQELWVFGLWQCGGYAISLCCVLLAARMHEGVPWLMLAMMGPPIVAQSLNGLAEFLIRRPDLRPSAQAFRWGSVRYMISVGIMFFALQILTVISTSSDSIIIAQVKGAAAVAPYGVMTRLFQVTMVISLFVQPLWPAFGEALARNDYEWASRAMKRALYASLVPGLVIALVLVLLGHRIVELWIGARLPLHNGLPTQGLIDAFAAWIVLGSYGGPITTLLNNGDLLRKQLVFYAVSSLVALALKIPLIYLLGVPGAVWATVFAYVIFYCIPAGALAYRTLEQGRRSNVPAVTSIGPAS